MPGWGTAESQMRGLGTPVSGGREKTHLTGVEGPRGCGEQPLPLQLRPGLSGPGREGGGRAGRPGPGTPTQAWFPLLRWNDSPVSRAGVSPRVRSGCGPICKSNHPVSSPVHTRISAAPGCCVAAREPRGLDGELQTAGGGGGSSQAPRLPLLLPLAQNETPGLRQEGRGEGLGRAGPRGLPGGGGWEHTGAGLCPHLHFCSVPTSTSLVSPMAAGASPHTAKGGTPPSKSQPLPSPPASVRQLLLSPPTRHQWSAPACCPHPSPLPAAVCPCHSPLAGPAPDAELLWGHKAPRITEETRNQPPGKARRD